MNHLNYLATFLLLLLFLAISAEQVKAQHPGSVSFWHLTPQQGLSQTTGKAIIQDYKGFMWIGTQDGLNKYNGHEITVYKHEEGDSSSLGYNDISSLLEDSDNNLWIGTQGGGLNLYNRETDDFTRIMADPEHPEKGITNRTVFSLMEDDKGNLWIGTNNGLNIRESGQEEFRHIFSDPDDPSTLSSNYIEHIYQDSKGTIWVGTYNGLNKYLPELDVFERLNDMPGSHHVYEIYEDTQGTIWIGTEGGGLFSYDYESDSFDRYLHDSNDPASIADNSVFTVLEDSKGILWIGTENEGLDVLDRETGTFYHFKQNTNDPNSLNNNAVYSIYENNDQLLWVGTFAGGINIFDIKKPKFQHFRRMPHRPNSLSNNSVLSFLEDKSGNFWVGTDGGEGGGLNLFDRNSETFTQYSHDPGNPNTIPSNVILELIEGEEGYIWLGTYQGGVSRFDYENNRFKHYKHAPDSPSGLSSNSIFALYKDREGNIWAGSNGEGVDVLRAGTGQFESFGSDSVRMSGYININYVRAFYEDSRGYFWIGTYGAGIIRYNRQNETFKAYHVDNSTLSNSVILCITEDKKNRLWIGTRGGGINLFNYETEEFIHYNTNNGLPSDLINGILEDDKGNLWLSTNEGLSKFNPDSVSFSNYGMDDGMQSREFNPGAYYADREGYFYFGGINGFNRFHPDSIKVETNVHPLVLIDFKIFNKSVSAGENAPLEKHISEAEEIELSYKESVLTFEYASLNFNQIKGNSYAYKMEGFDPDWNYVGSQRSATYTNLDAGEYTFRVKASNSDGIWSEEEASVKIVITPPFWETAWFYFLTAALLILIGISIYRYRVRNIREQNILLEKEVKSRTAELDNRNKELKETLTDLENTRNELIEKAHKAGMADIATGVLHNVGNILNSVNTSSSLIDDTLQKSKLGGLEKANKLLQEHIDDLDTFITKNPKGKKLMNYYLKLEKPLKEEQKSIMQLSQRLSNKIKLINEVISAQQSYATATTNSDKYKLPEIVDEAMVLNSGSSERHSIKIEKNYESFVPVVCQKTKLVHVLVNIFKNAKEAMAHIQSDNKILTIHIKDDSEYVYLSISDNGYGISKENLAKIFNQGFTTKKDGHGFGLHSSANYIREMGADIKVESGGKDKGAVFTLIFERADAGE